MLETEGKGVREGGKHCLQEVVTGVRKLLHRRKCIAIGHKESK